VVSRQNADISNTLHLRDVAMATIFVFVYMGCTLAHLANTVHVWQQCGLMSNYFDHYSYYYRQHCAQCKAPVYKLLRGRVVKLPVIYVGGKLPVTYR